MSEVFVEVLIPTFARPAALAVTLAGLSAQSFRDFRVVISDQSPEPGVEAHGEVMAMVRILGAMGVGVRLLAHRDRRGLAEQRQFLLDESDAPYVLFLDDDIWLTPSTLRD